MIVFMIVLVSDFTIKERELIVKETIVHIRFNLHILKLLVDLVRRMNF